MKTYTAVVERDQETGLYVGYVPGFPGAHSQGETIEEIRENLVEVISMLLEYDEPKVETEFIESLSGPKLSREDTYKAMSESDEVWSDWADLDVGDLNEDY